MLVQAILIGLIAAFGKLDYQLGTLYAFRPIVLCPLVGIVLGDLQSGLAIGASLELLFMGSISIGAYVPPDECIGGVLACAFAIQLGQSTEAAIALAMPIATLCTAIKNVVNAGMPLLVDRADVFASKGNLKGIYAMHWIIGLVIVVWPLSCARSPSIWVPTLFRACSTSSRRSSSMALASQPTSCLPWASPCSAVWCLPSSSCRSTSGLPAVLLCQRARPRRRPDRNHHRHRQVRPAGPWWRPVPAFCGRG